jgi:chromosome partitioning protein
MKVLALLSRKGGTGKGTIARSIAIAALMDGRSVGIVDADEQASMAKWAERRPHAQPLILHTSKGTIKQHIATFRKAAADLVVIDTPPNVQPIINLAIAEADAALIVTGVFFDDLEQVAALVDMLKRVKKPTAIVLNRTPTRSAALTLARNALATFSLPICPQPIALLVAHPYAGADGLTASEREPGGRAAEEIGKMWEWLKKMEFA